MIIILSRILQHSAICKDQEDGVCEFIEMDLLNCLLLDVQAAMPGHVIELYFETFKDLAGEDVQQDEVALEVELLGFQAHCHCAGCWWWCSNGFELLANPLSWFLAATLQFQAALLALVFFFMLPLLAEHFLLHHVQRAAAIQWLWPVRQNIPLISEDVIWLICQASDPISLNTWSQQVLAYGDDREVVQIPNL